MRGRRKNESEQKIGIEWGLSNENLLFTAGEGQSVEGLPAVISVVMKNS
jgi:hypothetical protein